MRRLFVDKIDNIMSLTGENHIHLSVVLRAKKGEEITLCDGSGYDYTAVITEFKKLETMVQVIQKRKNLSEPEINVSLFFAALKGDKNELIVQKGTELGIRNFYPLITRFSQIKPDSIKNDRLGKIALEAAKQCGRGMLPKVYNAISFDELLKSLKGFDAVVFPYEKAETPDINAFLSERKTFANTAIIIGGEGGFSDEEAALLKEINVTPLTLGKRILRAETACIAVTALVMNAAGELK